MSALAGLGVVYSMAPDAPDFKKHTWRQHSVCTILKTNNNNVVCLQYISKKATFMLLTLAVDKTGTILRECPYEIYTVVTAAMYFDKRRVYIRIYLATVLFAFGSITGAQKPLRYFNLISLWFKLRL